MIKISDGKIGMKEFLGIVIIAIATQATDTTPDLLLFRGANAAWMIPIFTFAMILLPLYMVMQLVKRHNVGLMEIIFSLTGKYVGAILGTLLFIMIFFSTTVNSRSYVDIINTMFYPNTEVAFFFVIILLTSFFVAIRGFEAIGRTAWLIVIVFAISAIFLIIFVWKDLNWYFIHPIAGPGVNKLLITSFTSMVMYKEIILLAIFFPFLRSYKDYRRASIVGLVISSIWIALFILIPTIVYDYPAVVYMNYVYQQLTRIASIGTFSRLEALFLGIWVAASVLHFAIYLYICAFIFAKTLRLKNFESLILPLAGLALFLGLVPDNIVILNQLREKTAYVSSSFLIVVPLLLLVIDRWKGWKKG